MNKFYVSLLVAVGIALVYSETCTVNTDCLSTQCSNSSSVICQHPDGDGITTDGGLCTCSDSQAQCQTREDCYKLTTLNCQATQRHCYDNTCICDRFPIGK